MKIKENHMFLKKLKKYLNDKTIISSFRND